jgi:hypothetical protein
VTWKPLPGPSWLKGSRATLLIGRERVTNVPFPGMRRRSPSRTSTSTTLRTVIRATSSVSASSRSDGRGSPSPALLINSRNAPRIRSCFSMLLSLPIDDSNDVLIAVGEPVAATLRWVYLRSKNSARLLGWEDRGLLADPPKRVVA